MRCSYDKDPGLSAAVFNLLDEVFPGLSSAAGAMRALGACWEEVSTPYVRKEDGRIVAHVGVIELPLVLMGAPVRVGSVHAVATHPDHRRRGFYRELMQEVIASTSRRFDALLLTTENPEYYEPLGFRRIPESYFRLPLSHPGGDTEPRRFRFEDRGDVALLQRLIATRQPVSRMAGLGPAYAVFCFNECHRGLLYSEALDVALAMELAGDRLILFDVAGPSLPSLAALLDCVPRPISEIIFRFSPDRFAPRAQAVEYLPDYGGPSYLMVRGPLAVEGRPFSLPRSGRT